MRKINFVVVHCSATDNLKYDNIETIEKWHLEENGWAGIGYHFFINKKGGIYVEDL